VTGGSAAAKWVGYVLTYVVAGLIGILFLMVIFSTLGWRIAESPTRFSAESGQCYLMQVEFPRAHWRRILETRPQDVTGASRLELFEDEVALGPADTQHDDIRQKGKGRFSHWRDAVYFASSDNTDPRTNGRSYRIEYPVFVPYDTLFLVTVIAIGFAYLRSLLLGAVLPHKWFSDLHWAAVSRRVPHVTLVTAWAMFIVPFCMVFFPYVLFYFLPLYQNDANAYSAILHHVSQHRLPSLVVAPGYPLFVATLVTLTGSLGAVPVAQILFLLTATLLLLYEIYRSYGWVCIPASLAMTGFIASPSALIDAASIMTESTYTSCLILTIALLFRCVRIDTMRNYLLLALVIGIAIIIRPAGLFLIGSIVLLLVYLRARGKSVKYLLTVPAPALAVLAITICYNYSVTGQASISPVHALSLPASVALFWKQDPSLSPPFCQAIQSYHNRVPPQEFVLVKKSWDLEQLYKAFERNVGPAFRHLGAEVGLWTCMDKRYTEGIISPDEFGEISDQARKMAALAIQASPMSYVKLFAANTYAWFTNIKHHMASPYAEMCDIFLRLYGERSNNVFQDTSLPVYVRAYYQALPLPNFRIRDDDTVIVTPSALQKLHLVLMSAMNPLFFSMLWVWAFLAIALTSSIQWIRTGFGNERFFLLAFITTIPIGAAALVSLGAVSLIRYSYPTQFVYYLSVALLPLLLGAERNAGELQAKE
jgi:hypothetical protein